MTKKIIRLVIGMVLTEMVQILGLLISGYVSMARMIRDDVARGCYWLLLGIWLYCVTEFVGAQLRSYLEGSDQDENKKEKENE